MMRLVYWFADLYKTFSNPLRLRILIYRSSKFHTFVPLHDTQYTTLFFVFFSQMSTPTVASSRWQWFTGFGLFLLLSLAKPCQAQTTYYVAAIGSDINNGRSASTPFQSLAQVNRLLLQPGDSVLFRRGDTFRGSLTIGQSGLAGRPIVVDAYGTGSKPVLAGSVALTNWTNLGNNTWQTTCAACGDRVTGVYRNDTALPLGRYPNADAPNQGRLTVQSHIGTGELTSKQPLTTDWTGAEVVVQATQWIIDRAPITRQNDRTLTLANQSRYELTDTRWFFIQNHPATLDQPGEWYYNPATKTIRLYEAQGNPNSQVLTATAFGRGVDLSNRSFVTLRNLRVTQTLTESLYAANASNLTLTNNEFINSGEDGVIFTGAGATILIENNRIQAINNNGFWIEGYQNVTLRGNTLRRIGAVAGLGKSGDGQYNGLHSISEQATLIENNVIDSVGYNGIDLAYSSNTLLQRNRISNFCLVKSDGGGIYLWNGLKKSITNNHLIANIVFNGLGTPDGSAGQFVGANGIFLDDCLENVELTGNSVFNCHGYGIYLHGVSRVNATGNTSFNNSFSQFTLYDNGGYCPIRANVIRQNVFVTKNATDFVAVYASNTNDLNQYGTLDANQYVRPFADAFKIRSVYNGNIGADVTLPQWRTQSGQETNSQDSPVTYSEHILKNMIGTARIASTFTGTSDGWSTFSSQNNGQVAWDNSGKLDGGSLRTLFPTASGVRGAYLLLTNDMGSVAKGKSYLLRFDAVATGDTRLQTFIRQRDAPYQDLDKRFELLVNTSRKSYELAFTANADEANTLLAFQVDEDGQSVYIDNIRLQEAAITRVNPDDDIRFAYNATPKDTTIALTGFYRDVKNRAYSRSVVLPPFTSIVLLRDTSPLMDVSLTLQIGSKQLKVGEITSVAIRLRNDQPSTTPLAQRVTWSCRLPPNLQVVNATGLALSDNKLTGTAYQFRTDTTFVFQVKPMLSGLYRLSAQVSDATFPDPDSTPNSGTVDGEDDAATTLFLVGLLNFRLFTAPDVILPTAPAPTVESASALPIGARVGVADDLPARADLSLRMVLSQRVPALNDLISCTLTVSNEGPVAVGQFTVQNQLPAGLAFSRGANWTVNGDLLTITLTNLPIGATVSVSFQARVVAIGYWTNHAEIVASDQPDPDSVPGNGLTNGEDDQAQADFRTR